ncbi:hypothetical protein M3Y99_00139800 [Aphelenchoides fujianensis]|nr:hypothetical protein M3Y99_00139800 [Aphelenchoides fujianensis]
MSEQAGDPLVFQRQSCTRRSESLPSVDEQRSLLLHDRLNLWNEFCVKGWPVIRFSPDGHHAFLFVDDDRRFHVLDLVRNTQLVFKSDPIACSLDVCDFAVVSPTELLVLEFYDLWLCRLDVQSGTLKRIRLEEREDQNPTYVFTEISGTHVDVKRTVLNHYNSSEVRFVRLDVDNLGWKDAGGELMTAAHDYRLSADGRRLFGLSLDSEELDTLHVFDIEQKTWSTKKVTGEIGRLQDCLFAWAADRVFLCGYEEVGEKRRYSVFRLDLRQLAWTKLPIVADNVRQISAIVDEESGEAGGLLILNEDEISGQTEVFRLLFRTPDSLVRLAVDALRRHNLDVVGKQEFHTVMNGPCKNVFPSLYAGMTHIPRL